MRGAANTATNPSRHAAVTLFSSILLVHTYCLHASNQLRHSGRGNDPQKPRQHFHLEPVNALGGETQQEEAPRWQEEVAELLPSHLGLGGPLADAATAVEQWGSSIASAVAPSPRTTCDPIANISRIDGLEEVCGPQAIIGGAMKCGTNSLAQLLMLHPRVWINRCPDGCTPSRCANCRETHYQGDVSTMWESHYFTHRTTYHHPPVSFLDPGALQNLSDVIAHTDGTNSITLDKSPSYLDTHLFPSVPWDVKRLLPHAKLIFSVCDPAGRLYAEYYHSRKLDNASLFGYFRDAGETPPTSFTAWAHALLDKKHPFCLDHPPYCARMRAAYLGKGSYLQNLQPWIEAFGQQSVLVLEMTQRSEVKVRRMLAHLGLPEDEYPWGEISSAGWAFKNDEYAGRDSAWREAPREMRRLAKYYKSSNAQLANVLNAQWPLEW